MSAQPTPNKLRQRERMTRYFLDAAKELIRAEGTRDLTTKKIGDKAGYSYATIYNYFANFNELICLAVEELSRELADTMKSHLPGSGGAVERISTFARHMVRHHCENTNLYFPFLSTDIDFSWFEKRDGHPFVHPAYPLVLSEIHACAHELDLGDDDCRQLADILSYIFHAKLHFFIRYGVPRTADQLEAEIEAEVRFVLGRRQTGQR